MTRTQKIQLQQSEARQALAKLLDTPLEKRSESFDSDLESAKATLARLESELQAAITLDGEPEVETRETREFQDLERRSNVGELFDSVLEHRNSDGAMAELQGELGLASNQLPLSLLRSERLETRAITPAPADVGQNQQEIIPYVFPSAAAAFLGVDMPTVGVGEAVFPGPDV